MGISKSSLINAMVPSIARHFRSYYYPATYISPIDLNNTLPTHECPINHLKDSARRLSSLPGVQEVLSDPLSYYEAEITKKNRVLQGHNFQILGSKPIVFGLFGARSIPYYSVSEHRDLPGWLIKAAGHRVPEDKMILGV